MSMLKCIIALSYLAVVSQYHLAGGVLMLDAQWVRYKLKYSKLYQPIEDEIRKNIWKEHKQDIDAHNVQADMEWHDYHMKVNEFSDMTPREIAYKTKSSVISDENLSFSANMYKKSGDILPVSIDWRNSGWVGPVIHQSGCESSWAISAIGAAEVQISNKTGSYTELSFQDLIDCTTSDQNCDGGWPDVAYQDILSNGGSLLEGNCNKYKANKRICSRDDSCVSGRLLSFSMIEPGDESALQDALVKVGPVSAGISLHVGFLSYKSGVYSHSSCPSVPTHSVLIVGYGIENGIEYWLVKNSFGEQWGDNGYIKMARNQNNMCGITSRASVPIVQ